MKKLLPLLLIVLLFSGCDSDDIIDTAKTALGITDKFTAEIDGDEWAADVRVVKKLNTPVANFTIVGTSLKGSVISITVGNTKEGTYKASLTEALTNFSTNVFIGTYTPNASQTTNMDGVYITTSGSVEITEIGTKDGKNFISGTFNMKVKNLKGEYSITKGVFTELTYKEASDE